MNEQSDLSHNYMWTMF